MKVQTMSVVVGTQACNARCPYCISQMTPSCGVEKAPPMNWHNFRKCCLLAKAHNVNTVLITSKGEPTLYSDQINEVLEKLEPYNFPLIEMQTNGIPLARKKDDTQLNYWHYKGLDTFCLSVVHWQESKNRTFYLDDKADHYNLTDFVGWLHSHGYSIRLTAVLLKDYINSPGDLQKLIDFCRVNKIEQLTVRPPAIPKEAHGDIPDWIRAHYPDRHDDMCAMIRHKGNVLMELVHGATVYDYEGQNVCISNCLTINPKDVENLRQIIYFPDGHIRYDWQYQGAILL